MYSIHSLRLCKPIVFCRVSVKSSPPPPPPPQQLLLPTQHRALVNRRAFSCSVSPMYASAAAAAAAAAGGKRSKGPTAKPRPSSSVIVFSPRNQILLLARVKTSSSFASAHVFPGGNVDTGQDGALPPEDSPERHQDSLTYRLAAIRECFEESGILLAKTETKKAGESSGGGDNNNNNRLLQVPEAEREAARRGVHSQEVKFTEWLADHGAEADTAGLLPFTRFVTPTSVPRRFTTQMYVYFLPLDADEEGVIVPGGRKKQSINNNNNGATTTKEEEEEAVVVIPVPKADGGVEHTAAKFLWPSQWLEQARAGEVIMYPPQVLLCSLVADFFPAGEWSVDERRAQRERCLAFLRTGEPPWGEKVMCPDMILGLDDGRAVLGLHKPGPELEGTGRRGDPDRVVLVRSSPDGPRDVEVRWKKDVLAAWRGQQQQAKEKL